jgi:hypothetical protein
MTAAFVSRSFRRNLRTEIMNPRRPLNGSEPAKTEDDEQREELGPRGVPGAADPATMTPQREKKMPENDDPGHTA